MKLAWTPKSIRAFKRLIRKNPQLRSSVAKTLSQLEKDCFDPSLKTHKLTGDLANVWSCSIDYQNRILFEFIKDEETNDNAILLLNIGSHDEVY